jgi:tetratricopeptide (TPR) repeat protein
MNKPPLASPRFPRRFAWGAGVAALLCLLFMGYYLREKYSAQPAAPASPSEAAERARLLLENGTSQQRREALMQLVAARAEAELAQCLAANNEAVVQLAIAGLWECWLNEAGPEPRRTMEEGIDAMNSGNLEQAAQVFTRLMAEHPHWAEAINKQATVLYLQGRPEESAALCRQVVARKPDHFGAWNGLALCAIQVEDWPLALQAVRESLRLQPKSPSNLQLLKLVESRLPQA